MKRLTVLCLAALSTASFAQFSFSGPGGSIPDGAGSGTAGAPFVSVAAASGLPGAVTEVWVSFNGLAHTWVGDTTFTLTSPGGTVLDLLSRPGRGSASLFGFSSDFDAANSYTFRDSGTDLFNTTPPAIIPTGVYRSSTNPNPPATNLLAWSYAATSFSVYNGQNGNGNWTLTATDWAGGDVGTLTGWTVHINAVPEPATMAVLGLGAVALMRRRRARK